ncbi:multicopper oxidase/laccase [Favolaschia claudopus]|uniref:Multicopper oxidase/laccase n=1 Tax=Favolaschia claudopus TaxID=2862362 RepID=A0AAW0DUM9_9AGAR
MFPPIMDCANCAAQLVSSLASFIAFDTLFEPMKFPGLVALVWFASTYATDLDASFGPGNGSGKTLNINLEIVNKNLSVDGFSRSTVVAGGTFPGTPILANEGDRLLINVVDKLTDATMLRSTSIHWHGVFQHGISWADGTAFVTQCPISPGNSFLYDFTPARQAGTFWYHSHLSLQYTDGLRGPLIIYDPLDPHKRLYDIDNVDTIITLADWFHTPSRYYPTPYLASSNLINGKGRYAGGPATPLSVISVKLGKRYRFRLISMSAEPSYVFSIDKHNMTIIEADGVSTLPVCIDSLHILAGQRYSFVLNAIQTVDNYWLRSVPNLGDTSFDGGVNSAILRYVGAPNTDPKATASNSVNPLLETDLHPLTPVPVPGRPYPGGADVSINLDMGLVFTSTGPRYTMNGATFSPPSAPALLQILSGAQLASELLPTGSYYALPKDKVVEISIPGGSDPGSPHPFHLHGHNFHVIRSACSKVYNYKNPVTRDVVDTGLASAGDNVTFRFETDNAGPWFLHCHVDTHLEIGLAVVLAEDIPAISKEVVPNAWKDLCPTYDALSPDQL